MTTNATREQGTGPRDRVELRPGDVAGLLLLRLGLGGVLVWFGAAELHSPGAWSVFVPKMFHAVESPLMFVHATVLLVAGAFLAVGMFHRFAAWVSGLILLAILGALVLTGAIDSVFVRDIGLAAAAFALALSPTAADLPGVDRWLASRPGRGYAVTALGYTALLAVVVGVLAATSVSSAGSSQAFSNLSGLGGTSTVGSTTSGGNGGGASGGASGLGSLGGGSTSGGGALSGGTQSGASGSGSSSANGGSSSGSASSGATSSGSTSSGSTSSRPSGAATGSSTGPSSSLGSVGALAPSGSGH